MTGRAQLVAQPGDQLVAAADAFDERHVGLLELVGAAAFAFRAAVSWSITEGVTVGESTAPPAAASHDRRSGSTSPSESFST